MIVSLSGMMGCGKSSVGKVLADKLGFTFIDLDRYVEKEQSETIPAIFNKGGETLFRKYEAEALKHVLAEHSGRDLVLSLGGGTLTVEENRRLIVRDSICIYLKATSAEIGRRLALNGPERPMLKGRSIDGLMKEREALYEKAACHTIVTDGLSIEESAAKAAALVIPRL